jgi:integrase
MLAGVHPKVVSERLGHATVSFTLDTYSHLVRAMQQNAAEDFEAILNAETAPEKNFCDQM